jgi:hypothetical protein
VNNPIDAHARNNEEMERMLGILTGTGAYDIVFSTSLGADVMRWDRDDTGAVDELSAEERAAQAAEHTRANARFMARLQDEIGLPILYLQREAFGRPSRTAATAAYAEGIATFPSVARAAAAVRLMLDWRARREGLPEIF